MKRNWVYLFLGMVILATYAIADLRGYELRQTMRAVVPQGLRGAHGGSRSFFYGGFHGGK